jgi:hypothetical protein
VKVALLETEYMYFSSTQCGRTSKTETSHFSVSCVYFLFNYIDDSFIL